MPLLYDEGQQAIANETRRLLEARVTLESQLPLLERQGAYDPVFWDIAREQGWNALTIPEAYGGIELGPIELGLVSLEAGRSLSGAPFLTTSYGVATALLASRDTEARAAWLPRLAAGDAIGAVAFGERQSPLPSEPAVTFSNGRLSGIKPAVIGGLHADVAVVLATEGEHSVLVVAGLDGVARRSFGTFDNSRNAAHIVFDGTPGKILTSGPAASALALEILAQQAVMVAHEQTGGAEKLLEIARDYAVTRRAFGQPIGAFQSVKHRIAELYVLVELSRASALHAATRVGRSDFIEAAAAARISATEAYDTAARDCIQIHGGIGVTWEGALHLHMRRARSLAIEQGNLLFWEDVLVDQITKAVA